MPIRDLLNRVSTTISKLAKSVTVNHFWVLIAVWIGVTVTSWYVVNPQVASALIGAGPLTLYYLYEEIGKKPVLDIKGGLQYQKHLFAEQQEDTYIVYPVITAFAEIENQGRSTARECFCQFSVGEDENHEGRWAGGRDAEEIDIHPGRTEQVRFVRIVPTMDSLNKINRKLRERGKNIEIRDRFLPINDSRNSYEPIEILGFQFDVQVPIPEDAEISRISRLGKQPEERKEFFGTTINPSHDLSIYAQFGANDWQMKKDFGTIDIEQAVEQAPWMDYDPEFQELREVLNSEDWKNR